MLGLALALGLSAHAASSRIVAVGTATRSGYEDFSVAGWGQACSAAVAYLRYPPLGQGLSGVPDAYRVGVISLAPDGERQKERWTWASERGTGWSAEGQAAAIRALRDQGRHDKAGTTEVLRRARVADQPGLDALINSTSVFKSDPTLGGFPDRFKFHAVHYSPLGSCALFVFRDFDSPRDGYRTQLARLPEPGVRHVRARAHVTNALLLYRNEADITAAEAELAVASAMDPRYALARYHHAVLLTLHGRFDDALASLKAAVAREGAYSAEARRAPEFEPFRDDPRFKAILASAPAPRRGPEPRRPGAAPGPAKPGVQPAPSPEERRSKPPERRRF